MISMLLLLCIFPAAHYVSCRAIMSAGSEYVSLVEPRPSCSIIVLPRVRAREAIDGHAPKSISCVQVGCAPGPGRPLGARSKLSELALKALRDDWPQRDRTGAGNQAALFVDCRELVAASAAGRALLPLADFTDDEFTMIEQTLRAGRARDVSEVSGTAVAVEPVKPEKP